MKHFISISVGVLGVIALVAVLFIAQPTKASSGDNISGWAWSSTIGWISMNCTTGGEGSTDICATADYGVTMNETTGVLSGYAWSPNVGWISFNASDLSSGTGTSESSAFIPKAHAQTTCTAATVFNPSSVADRAITGCIKVLNAASGWDGIIRLSGAGYGSPVASGLGGVTLKANDAFVGYAWGDTVMGWVNFNGIFLGEAQLRFIVNDGVTDNTESFTTTLGAGGYKDLIVKWEANGATECVATSNPQLPTWDGLLPTTTNLTGDNVSILENTDFTITCTYGATEVSKTITASIGGPTLSLSASPTSVALGSGESTTLTGSTTNAGTGSIPAFTSCELEINWGTKGDTTETKDVECPGFNNNVMFDEYVPGGDTGATTKYTLRAQYTGGTASAIAYVTVVSPTASISLTVSTAPTMSPGTLGLTWTSVNTSSCVANNGWSGSKAVSGTENGVTFNNSTTYTLSCASIYGGTVTTSLKVSLPGPGQKPRYQEL